MSASANIISRLARVQEVRPNVWRGSCPTGNHPHGDRSRGLEVEQRGNKALVICRAGCSIHEIVEAVGLELKDLFDDSGIRRDRRPGLSAAEMLEAVDHEALVLALIADDIQAAGAATPEQCQRLGQAAGRIARVRGHAHGQ